MAFFGLDIGSYAIKYVAAEGHGQHAKLRRVGSVYNPVGQILPEDKGQFEQLAAAIKNGIKEQGLVGQNCHLSLPGPQAYVSIINMPVLSDAELASAIKWEADQHIPVSMSEVNFEYDVIWRPEKGSTGDDMLVLLVGSLKKTVNRYLDLLEMVGIEAVGLEPEVLSLVRVYLQGYKGEAGGTLICNLGALSTSFAIVDTLGRLSVAHSAPIGSLALTRALERGLNLAPSQAEEYKRTYGLDAQQLEGRVRNVLAPVFESLISEIRRTTQFFTSKDPAINRVTRVILAGGGANLPGITSHIAQNLTVEVVIGDPFREKGADEKIQLPSERASFSVASGLAIKEM